MSTKQIADPRPFPEFHTDPEIWAREVMQYVEQHLREIHEELDNLHAAKTDVTP